MWPSISSMFIKWATPEEKSRLIGFASSGTNIGNIIALPLGGWLCEEGFYNGWGSIFIIFGKKKQTLKTIRHLRLNNTILYSI